MKITKLMKGQSLFEVVVAIGVAALVLVAAVSLSTTSLRNTDFSKNNALATKYAQEGSEYIRQQRDTDWTSFVSNWTGGAKNLGNNFTTSTSAIDSVFSRQVSKTVCSFYNGTTTSASACSSSNIVDVYVTVTWTDGSGSHDVNDVTTLSRWNK